MNIPAPIDEYVFDFGKHRGLRFWDVLNIDPQYLMWCHVHVVWFYLSTARLSTKSKLPHEKISSDLELVRFYVHEMRKARGAYV